MGQRLFEDKITTLSEAGGTITLPAGARLTIGGQQYVTSAALNVAATVAAANTRYQVFAILSGGVPILSVSTNENSVGPAGAAAWKLVGSYYTNGNSSIGFGSFVNIEGTPRTTAIPFEWTVTASTPPTFVGTNVGTYIIDGNRVIVDKRTTNINGDGSGVYGFNVPTSFPIDITIHPQSAFQNGVVTGPTFYDSILGSASLDQNATFVEQTGKVVVFGTSTVGISLAAQSSAASVGLERAYGVGSVGHFPSGNPWTAFPTSFTLEYSYISSALSNNQLKDL